MERLEKPKKEKLLLLMSENIGDRKLSVCNAECREKGIRRYTWFDILGIRN